LRKSSLTCHRRAERAKREDSAEASDVDSDGDELFFVPKALNETENALNRLATPEVRHR
jgi:hypothetical protein